MLAVAIAMKGEKKKERRERLFYTDSKVWFKHKIDHERRQKLAEGRYGTGKPKYLFAASAHDNDTNMK
jgi:hypothetical protein